MLRLALCRRLYLLFISSYLALFLLSCQTTKEEKALPEVELFLPDGFNSTVVVDRLEGRARHLAVSEKGDLYVKLQFPTKDGGVAALRDTDGDGKADIIKHFGKYGNEGKWSLQTGVAFYEDYIYYSSDLTVYRQKMGEGDLIPEGEMEIIVQDDHDHGRHEHIAKPISFDNEGHIYIPFGAPSNACQDPKRTPGAPGLDPCPQLEDHAGVWRFDAHTLNQTQEDGYKYATGIRSVVGMDWNDEDDELYLVMHGRDDLLRLFRDRYSPWESALLPSEEFLKVKDGDDYGWPYCYYDQIQEAKVLAPEYGGDGDSIGRCANFDMPIMGFPGHWAPNDILFYKGSQFPSRYQHGAFIAFHGSTNRAPYPQAGYFIAFIPFKDGAPNGEWEIFADGFAGVDPIVNVSDAHYRPMGIAEGPDGSLYLGDTEHGRIWKIRYTGEKEGFGESQLASMEARKAMAHIRTPDELHDNLQSGKVADADFLYYTYCAACHQRNGKGASGRFPSLVGTDWVTGDKERLIKILLNGMEGPIEVNGESYNGVMPQHSFLKDEEIAEVLTYIRKNFGNNASAITKEEVAALR